MTAIELKEAALYFLRFERSMTHIATEFGQYSADVVGATSDRLIELETKISLGDLRNDFKKDKHRRYLKASDDCDFDYNHQDMPNYFYFMVPPALADEAVRLCEEHNKYYGVVIYSGDQEHHWINRWKVVRRGKRMHTRKPNEKCLSRIAARMATEIVVAHSLKYRVAEMRTIMVDELRNRFDNPSQPELFEDEASV